jgi:hypothetical protein
VRVSYQAGSWNKPRRVVAKVEWHPGELYPRVGFIVTNLARPAERVVTFYNHRGTCEQYIKEGKGAIKWTHLSCRSFAANALRLQRTIERYAAAWHVRQAALFRVRGGARLSRPLYGRATARRVRARALGRLGTRARKRF